MLKNEAKPYLELYWRFCSPNSLKHLLSHGIYDLTLNKGWVSVGIDHDTAEFAVESIRHWWYEMGHNTFRLRIKQY